MGLSLLQQYADVYAPVIERLADRTARTDLEARFLRALFWYRSGRWQPNPTRRFLDHFVALEHLFTARSAGKAEPLANGVGRLFGSWMFRRGYFGIHISRTIRVAKSLWNSVAADPTLAEGVRDVADKLAGKVRKVDHWHSHVGPWLSPTFVGAVSDALPAERRSAEWGAHLLALTQLREGEARWRDRDESRAHSGWFLVHRLALRRNAIVHDAMTELPGADHEADALTSVVERVLMHIVEDLLTRPNVAHSMDDLLDELPAPWLE